MKQLFDKTDNYWSEKRLRVSSSAVVYFMRNFYIVKAYITFSGDPVVNSGVSN